MPRANSIELHVPSPSWSTCVDYFVLEPDSVLSDPHSQATQQSTPANLVPFVEFLPKIHPHVSKELGTTTGRLPSCECMNIEADKAGAATDGSTSLVILGWSRDSPVAAIFLGIDEKEFGRIRMVQLRSSEVLLLLHKNGGSRILRFTAANKHHPELCLLVICGTAPARF